MGWKLAGLAAALLAACSPAGGNGQAGAHPDDALARRDRSNARLRAEGVPVLATLPRIESEDEALRRQARPVIQRALALLVVSMKGEGLPEARYRAVIARFRLDRSFSPKERAFLADPSPTQHDRAQFSWQVEAACVLLWSVGLGPFESRPSEACEAGPVDAVLDTPDLKTLVERAKPQPIARILDEADLIYRYRWALVEVEQGRGEVPEWLNGDIAMERHRAFNWLVENPAVEWDEVTLDT